MLGKMDSCCPTHPSLIIKLPVPPIPNGKTAKLIQYTSETNKSGRQTSKHHQNVPPLHLHHLDNFLHISQKIQHPSFLRKPQASHIMEFTSARTENQGQQTTEL